MTQENMNPESTSFGREQVTPDQKTDKVLGVFDSVATKYDIMNDVMSGGVHRIWKDKFVTQVSPQVGQDILDMAGGTGDIAFRHHKKTNGAANITVSDINQSMLDVGQDRALDRGITNMEWVATDAAALPFDDNSFDIYTLAFGLRNVTKIDDALAEAARVLRPGGKFYCLEFSHVDNPIIKKMYDIYSDQLIPKFGEIVAKDRTSYEYLVESIRKFPRREALKTRLLQAGFSKATFTTMTFGVVAIHEAQL
jgi:demethylmenaquinone methyltransferase/2-methoxy-6-polyprenyl-1,4-benzoquinol methylase